MMKMKRLVASILAVFMLVSMIPGSVFAVEGGVAYGTVESISQDIAYRGNIRTGNEVVATYAGALQKSAAPVAGGETAWWVGVKMIAPDGYDPENACYTVDGATLNFEENKTGDNYIELWSMVTPEILQATANADGMSTCTWVFDWDGDGADLQTVILNIDAYNTVLKDGEETVYYHPYGIAEKITDGVVFSESGAVVEGTYSGTLQWIEGNEVRQDGWWVGIKLRAPKEYDAEKASYVSGGSTKLFKDNKDGDDHIQLWGWVMPEFLESACQTDGLSTHIWEFNWDGEGEAEQTIKLNIDPYKTVLKKGEETLYAYESGAVQSITDGVTYKDGVQSGAVVEAAYAGVLQKAADPAGGDDAWWVGLKLTAPAHFNAEAATYTVNGEKKSFAETKNGDDHIELWGKVTPAYLAAACQDNGLCTYTWEFNWDGVGAAEQKIVLSIDARNTKLMEDGVQRYPSNLGIVNCYTGSDVEITGNGTGEVNVTVNKVSLTWSPANDAIGRSAGWWVGIGVTVPEEMKDETSEDVLKKIKYQVKNGPSAEWGAEKSFYANRDSAVAPHYMQLWFPVNPISLQKFKDEGRLMTMWYRFDWDGERGYDQTITFSLNPEGEIELQMEGTEPTIEPGQTYVAADGNTKVSFKAASVHGFESVTVDGVAAVADGESYVATLTGAKEKVTIEVKDIYGNVTKKENIAVQPKLTVGLSASGAAFSDGSTYYYNDEKKLSFNVAIAGQAEDGAYAIDTTVLTANGQPLESAVVAEEGALSDLKVVVTDKTGRTAEATLDGTYIYDKTAPVVTVKAVGENVVGFFTKDGKDFVILQNPVILKRNTPETVSFEVTVTDANLNPELYKTADGWTITGTTATKTFTVTVDDYANGQIDLDFTAVDMSGNKGTSATVVLPGKEGIATPLVESAEGVYSKTIYVDRRTPGTNIDDVPEMDLEIDGENAEGVYSEDFEVIIALQDNGAGIKNVTYNLEDAGGAVAQIASTPELRDGKYVIPVAIKNGCESDCVWLTVIATDNVGNSFEFHKNLAVDKKAPVIELVEGAVNNGTAAYYDGDATFLFSVGEMFGYDLEWKLDDTVGGSFLKLTTDKEYAYVTIIDGKVDEVVATLSVTAKDTSGHKSEVYSISFVVDNKAPEVVVSTNADSFVQSKGGVDYYADEVIYEIKVSDRFMEDGTYTLEATAIYEDGTETVDLTKIAGGDLADKETFTGSFTVADGKVLEDIRINVLDALENSPEEIRTISNTVVVDKTAPVVTVTTNAKDYIRTANGVDYFAGEVAYQITVTDQFLQEDASQLVVKAVYEDGTVDAVELSRAGEASEKIGEADTFSGSFTVANGKVLKDIEIEVLDAAKRMPANIVATVENSVAVALYFEREESSNIWKTTTNDVVADTTAPEVTVTAGYESYVQSVNGVDYFDGEVTYEIKVTDKFMEDGAYYLSATAVYEDGTEEPIELSRTGEASEKIGDTDTFFGSYKVVNGKVLTDIRINVLDAANQNPAAIKTAVNSSADVSLTFEEEGDAWKMTSNDVVVDTTIPEVSVVVAGENVVGFYTKDDKDFVVLKDPIKLKRNNSETVSFEVVVTDTNLNPELYQDADGWTIDGTTATKTFSVSVDDYANGQIDLAFTAVDMADNKGASVTVTLPGKENSPTPLVESAEGVYAKTIYVDRRTPGTNEIGVPEMEMVVEAENAEGIYFEDFEVVIALKDNGAGIKNVTYNLEDAGGAVAQIASAPELRDGKYVIPVAIQDGCESDRVWLTVIATDNVGNSFEFRKNYAVDKRTPVIELIEGAVNSDTVAYYDSDATFLFSVGEMFGYELDWTLDDTVGGNFLKLTTDKEYAYVTIIDGAVNEVVATLTLTATDVCGHVSETYTISFVVDNKAPEVVVSTEADSFVQAVNGVDYFSDEVKYDIVVSDRFMEDGAYTLEAEVTYEDGTETVDLIQTAGGELADKEAFTGSFTVADGKVLTDIRINVLDAVSRNPDEIVTVSEAAPLTFAGTGDIWNKSSNHVVVDKIAPVVTVTTDAAEYIQTFEDVDYFKGEVTYNITVTDQFMEKDTYTLEVKAIYQDGTEEIVESVTVSRDGDEPELIGAEDKFVGSFTVVDGKVLKDIHINVLDAAKRNPDRIVTEVANNASETPISLTFIKDANGLFVRSSNNICVDMTAPTVEICFSENVIKFYHRDEGGKRKYFALVEPVEGASGEEKNEKSTVEMTVTIKDVNITMDETSKDHYEVKNLIVDENAQWRMMLNESGEKVLTYSTSIVVDDDRTANLPFELQIYDLASNCPAEVTLVGENPEANYELPGFAVPADKDNDGIITVGDTIIIDRRRTTTQDQQTPELVLEMPEAVHTLIDENGETKLLYNGNLTIKLDAQDIDWSGAAGNDSTNSAGIERIDWEILGAALKEENMSGSVVYETVNPEDAVLVVKDYEIPVVTNQNEDFESNNVTLRVTVTDNAGNKVTKEVEFALDIMVPRVNVEYNDPAGNSPYFREIRTATIKVTDINFNPEATKIFVKPDVEYPVEWVRTEDTYSCEVRYTTDGDYEFSLTTTDLAQNLTYTEKDPDNCMGTITVPTNSGSEEISAVTINGPENATHVFTIDMTRPVIDVLYNPAQAVGKDDKGVEYFDEERTVEVIITDANFAPETTTITGNSQNWRRPYNGMENHYGTVFGEGNNYAVNVTSIDKAGNVAEPVNGVPFSVDLTAPTIEITTGEMTNGALNIVQDDLTLGFTINDVNSNLKSCEVIMQHVNGNFETITVSGEAYYTERNAGDRTTRYVDITNIAKEKANDGIYIVQINVTDYAEHTVSLTPELYMSLNRFGSSFIITDAATKAFLTGKEGEAIYRNEVKQNLIIQEINPNEVWQDETENQKGSLITLAFNGNANELVPDVNYSVIEEKMGSGSSTWYMYTYEIFTDNFYSNGQLVDGRYKLLFYSEDAAGNKNANETNVDSHLTQYESGATAGTAEFILDHQTPVVSVIGITQGQEIRQDNQVVEIGISDNAATFVMAYIDGKEVTLREYSADLPLDQNWFAYNAETGKYMLNIAKKNSRQDVKFVVTDAAGNETVYEVSNVLVTRNILVQYVNSVPALCITAVLVIAAVAIILFLKKKKKKETE